MSEPLLDKVKEELPEYRRSVLANLLMIVLAVLQKESCNLYKLRGSVGRTSGKVHSKPASHYRRMIRFFKAHGSNQLWLDLLCLCFRLLRVRATHLALDGTSWEYGSRRVHLLMLCVIYQGVAVPIYWHDLSKKGISSTEERMRLFREAMEKLNLSGKTLLADREYVGKEWLKFLSDSGIDFVVRLKRGAYREAIDQAGGFRYSALEKKILRSKRRGKVIAKDFLLGQLKVRIVMARNLARNDKDAIIYLITNKQTKKAKKVAEEYFIRWKIETCFKHMKSNGFDMEKINFKHKGRARLLVAVLVLAYTLSILEGLKQYKKVASKKYKNGTVYKAVSTFRKGIDSIAIICDHFKKLARYLANTIEYANKAYRNPNAIFV